MRIANKIIASALVAATALGAALPAQAQPYPRGDRYEEHGDHHDRYDRGDRYDGRYEDRYWNRRDTRGRIQAVRAQIDELQRRVERTDRRDRISEREAAGLRRDVYRLREQFRAFSRNGLSRDEMRVLQIRIDQVRDRLRIERNDWDNRRW